MQQRSFLSFSAILSIACCLCGSVTSVNRNETTLEDKENGENQLKPCSHRRFQTGIFGVDVSTATNTESFSCLKDSGYEFVIVRAFRSTGVVDQSAPLSIESARNAGFRHVDVYIFPCFRCGNPSSQVTRTVDFLSSSQYGMIWIDVEVQNKYWSNDKTANQKFFMEMLQTAQRFKPTGVYTSKSQWEAIMGIGFTGGTHVDLWYSHFDNNPSFSDFSPFGGWVIPRIKQYRDSVNLCGTDVDYNWHP